MQFQADLLNKPVLLPEITDSTALGAAYLSGITARAFAGIDEVASMNKIRYRYEPHMSQSVRERELAKWKKAVQRLILK
jgi:glycerol kinase